MSEKLVNSKKRERKNIVLFSIVLLLSIFLLMLSESTFANAETYNSSRPIIEVSYHEQPVTIVRFNLSDIDGSLWPVYNMSGVTRVSDYNFTVDYLSNGDYKFFILATDTDGNEVDATKDFSIDHGGMKVWLVSPKPAIGKTPRYNITVQTEFNAICRYGVRNPDCNNSTELLEKCRFDRMSSNFQETGNRTIQRIVNYEADIEHKKLYVACVRDVVGTNLTDPESYGDTNFMVGYDPTVPIITELLATPNPVVDVNLPVTDVTATTNEPTVCRLNGGNALNYTSFYFNNADPEEYSDYTLDHQAEIEYYYMRNNPSTNFFYDVVCYDRAQWYALKNLTVTVFFNTTLTITQVTPAYVGATTIDYEIQTNLLADCYLRTVNDSNWRAMNINNNNNTHVYDDLSLALGTNRIQVRCDADRTAYRNFTIIADNVRPTLDIVAKSETCGLDAIEFEMNASDEGSGINSYWYRIENSSGGLLRNWTQTDDETITYRPRNSLNDGETYKILAYATDNSGLESTIDTVSIIAHSGNSIACDETDPVVRINVTGGDYLKSIYVNCTDNVGCTDSFSYDFVGVNRSCSNVNYTQTKLYSALPLQVESNTKLCVKVFDKNENYARAEKIIYAQTIACGNGIIELGEDCDGTSFNGFDCEDFDFDEGILQCNAPGTANECQWNTDNCAVDPYGYCGDNKINNYFNEQCDGSGSSGDWGEISKSTNDGCEQFGFDSGRLTCNPSSAPKGQRCMFNTSQCVQSRVNNNPRCDGGSGLSTTLLDPREQCEPSKNFTLGCSDFNGFDGGKLVCLNSCMFDISGCNFSGSPPINETPKPKCLNGVLDPGEECDGQIKGDSQSFITLLGCDKSVQCANDCTIECTIPGGTVTNTCINTVKDGDETDINCGGSCPKCEIEKECIFNSDCKSGNCDSNTNVCIPAGSGGEQPGDTGEEPTGEETPEKPNIIGIIILIIGILCVLGGAGYVIYEEYFDKKKKKSSGINFSSSLGSGDLMPSQPEIIQDPRLTELQKQKLAEKRQQQQQSRKSLLEGFDKDTKKEDLSDDDVKKLEEKTSSKDKDSSEKYVDLTGKKNKDDSENTGDVFDKLKGMGKSKSESKSDSSEETITKFENTNQSNDGSSEDDSNASKSKKFKKSKTSKKKSETFEALGSIGQNVKEVPTLSLDIESLTGKPKSTITKMLNSDTITDRQLTNIFGGLDRRAVTSKEFRNILSDLSGKGKIDKDSISRLLFEYISKGDATKADVAKILSELKMI